MAKRMLIDATHPEETRVVLLNGNRLEEYDFETSTKKQLKGNIYLAKVTRVEPSLQACFVEFGGNRHGFLAFSEIHPDYWQIPIADREALLAEERRLAEREREQDAEPHSPMDGPHPMPGRPIPVEITPPADVPAMPIDLLPLPEPMPTVAPAVESMSSESGLGGPNTLPELTPSDPSTIAPAALDLPSDRIVGPEPTDATGEPAPGSEAAAEPSPQPMIADADEEPRPAPVPLESVGGEGEDDDEDEDVRRPRFKPMRHYKIQEVIKRRQVLLVQVVKEERGTKGAALTTYLSLAGRYCVLMPNTTRGGGISRRITSQQDRKRLKEIMHDLDVPDGTAVILRTAGMERSKQEIRRDYEYLMRLWDEVRELTLTSRAPTLVYEEGTLIKRTIRDLYTRDIDEIQVEGREGFNAAQTFMRMLMPDHAEKIRLYDDGQVPLFQRFQVEPQLDEMHETTVRLRSGGYIVINQTEALVAIDVNSGRATRERHIEETALKTNIEAAEEVARQLRLRDLAGLIVIDFIDMEDNRHIAQVERRLKEAMRTDRARIQIGRISAFGLLELSRQRLRPSLAEVSTQRCPHCAGTGFIRSTESTALRVLRGIEEEGLKSRSAALKVSVPASVAVYILNQKRAALAAVEQRHGLEVSFETDDTLIPPAFRIERLRTRERAESGPAPIRAGMDMAPEEAPPAFIGDVPQAAAPVEFDEPLDREPVGEGDGEPSGAPAGGPPGEDGGRRRRRRRRRRGRGGREDGQPLPGQAQGADNEDDGEAGPEGMDEPAGEMPPAGGATEFPGQPQGQAPRFDQPRQDGDDDGRRRRRGRRGGRRRRGGEEFGQGPAAPAAPADGYAPSPYAAPEYPTTPYAEPAPVPVVPPAAPSMDPDDDLRARARELYAQAARFPQDVADPAPIVTSTPQPAVVVPPVAPAPVEPPPVASAPAAPTIPAPAPTMPPASAPAAAAPTGETHEWPWNRRAEAPAVPPAASVAPVAAEPAPEPPRAAAQAAPVEPAPAEPEPKGPPKKGWWRRLTS
ncbi:MAG: Rne/Rng family ribonuclease [Alphaproteobacteria bacterium]|nr:Rne/Rng family ribonuclease [Alphaproteobacteria bacterium]